MNDSGGIKIERHLGEVGVKVGIAGADRKLGKRETQHGSKPWPAALGAACARRQHGQCFRRNCTCACHKLEREAMKR